MLVSLPLLSVVIPTHQRSQCLRQCLTHLARQTIADRIEVIVVSDGPDPQTATLFAGIENGQWIMDNGKALSVRYFSIGKSQQGTARNRGVKEAKGNIVLFIGDDIFLAPDACAAHLRAHADTTHYPLPITHFKAVLGFTTWDSSVGITPAMWWLERTGWQFGYPKIARYAHGLLPIAVQHCFTYTSHISIPARIARENTFREDVSLYGWEDIEWGLRLSRAGGRLQYEPSAQALHHHRVTLDDSLARMETLGRSAVVIERLVPELRVVPRDWKRLAYRIFALVPTLRGRHARAFLRGIRASS